MASRQDGDYSDYSNFLDQTENTFGMSNPNTHNVAPVPQNTTYGFYFPLPDGRLYYITYTELPLFEIARLLNNRVNLSHVPDNQIPHHHNIQSFIQQQFLQQPVDYQQNNGQYAQPTPQVHSYDNASIPSNGTISDDIQDAGCNGIQGNSNAQ